MKDNESGEVFTAETDNFGDFWFRGLGENRSFTLTIEKAGEVLTLKDITSEKDLSLGDIPMAL